MSNLTIAALVLYSSLFVTTDLVMADDVSAEIVVGLGTRVENSGRMPTFV